MRYYFCYNVFRMNTKTLSYSQNFLKDPSFVSSLVNMSSIDNTDTVIEIGPGKGIITKQLSLKAKKVIGIEYDHNLAENLKNIFSDVNNVEIIENDFLKWQLPKYPYKVFSNIPFNISADIVNKLFVSSNSPEAAYLIMQDLAAKRFIGKPAGEDSQFSILLQPFYDMKIMKKINRREFQPVPNINIVLASFEKKVTPMIDRKYTQEYRDFVVYGYNQWKPTILDSFKNIFSYKQLNILSKRLNIKDLKPSEVSVDKWIDMFNTFIQYAPEDKKKIVRDSEKKLRNKQRGMSKENRTRYRN